MVQTQNIKIKVTNEVTKQVDEHCYFRSSRMIRLLVLEELLGSSLATFTKIN